MKKNFVFVLLLIAVCIASCKKENSNGNEAIGTVQMGIGLSQQLLKSTAINETPSTIVITVVDSKGTVIIESKKVALMNMNGSFLSDPLSLTTGNYSITKFIVLNSADSAIYVTPIKGSKLAYLVNAPLPITFSISKDNVTKIVPEVLSVKSAKFEDFGYDGFSFNIVKTFDFLTTVMVYNETKKNWELTSANITIKAADNTTAYHDSVAAITNQITLRDNSASFSITVSKNGYGSYAANFTADDLKLYFKSSDKGPLIIKLFSESTTVTDIDGNVYHTVTIGTQVWMVENLRVTKLNDGTAIANVTIHADWINLTTPAFCWYNNDSVSYSNPYGGLYNWYVVKTNKLCPIGWHVPSDEEYSTLETTLGGYLSAAEKLKDATHWVGTFPGNNSSGFSALPGGLRGHYIDQEFSDINNYGFYWTTSVYNSTFPWLRYMSRNLIGFEKSYFAMQDGVSVRCIKD